MTDFLSCSSPQPQDIHLPFSPYLITNDAQRDVTYSCGSCGYELNLNSCNRNTNVIGSKYGKAMKRGVLSFLCIDESRFTQISKFRCSPYFRSKNSWGFFNDTLNSCVENAQIILVLFLIVVITIQVVLRYILMSSRMEH